MLEIRGKRGAKMEKAKSDGGRIEGFENLRNLGGGEGKGKGGEVVREVRERVVLEGSVRI